MNPTEEESNRSTASMSCDDPNPCPICLGHVKSDAFLDRCFHRYCYDCILRWTSVVSSRAPPSQSSSVPCPLCKTVNFSIIYGYVENKSQRGQSIFQRHYIGQDGRKSTFFSKAHMFRWWCYSTEQEQGGLNDAFDVTRYWRSRKYLQTNRWLQSWLMREIQALTQEEDVDIILHHILGVIESFSRSDDKRSPIQEADLKRAAFKGMVADAARPFLMTRTERFMHELDLFLASGLNIEAYDRAYKKKMGWQHPEETSQTTEHTEDDTDHKRTGPYSYLFEEETD
ncbi:hypothetical protein V2J09_022252 [Rumex salicifolius]